MRSAAMRSGGGPRTTPIYGGDPVEGAPDDSGDSGNELGPVQIAGPYYNLTWAMRFASVNVRSSAVQLTRGDTQGGVTFAAGGSSLDEIPIGANWIRGVALQFNLVANRWTCDVYFCRPDLMAGGEGPLSTAHTAAISVRTLDDKFRFSYQSGSKFEPWATGSFMAESSKPLVATKATSNSTLVLRDSLRNGFDIAVPLGPQGFSPPPGNLAGRFNANSPSQNLWRGYTYPYYETVLDTTRKFVRGGAQSGSGGTLNSLPQVKCIVVHTAEGAARTSLNSVVNVILGQQAGYHIVRDKDTEVVMCRPGLDVAFHVGNSRRWGNVSGGLSGDAGLPNNTSVGIALPGRTTNYRAPRPDVGPSTSNPRLDLIALASTAAKLCLQFGIPPTKITGAQYDRGAQGIIGHSDIDSRKSDPGSAFPWTWWIKEVSKARDALDG